MHHQYQFNKVLHRISMCCHERHQLFWIPNWVFLPQELKKNHQLRVRKLSARRVPHLLANDHKSRRLTTSRDCLALITHNSESLLRRSLTVDVASIYHNTPKITQQSNHRVSSGKSLLKKAKIGLSAKGVMVFREACGIILINYLQKEWTINSIKNRMLTEWSGSTMIWRKNNLIATVSVAFCRFSPQWIFPVSNLQK